MSWFVKNRAAITHIANTIVSVLATLGVVSM